MGLGKLTKTLHRPGRLDTRTPRRWTPDSARTPRSSENAGLATQNRPGGQSPWTSGLREDSAASMGLSVRVKLSIRRSTGMGRGSASNFAPPVDSVTLRPSHTPQPKPARGQRKADCHLRLGRGRKQRSRDTLAHTKQWSRDTLAPKIGSVESAFSCAPN